MLSQVLMSLSARHHRHPAERGPGRDVKEEVSHDQAPLQLHHSPEISSTQGTSVSSLSSKHLSEHQRYPRTATASAATRRRRT